MPLALGNKGPRGVVGLDIDGRFIAAVQSVNGQVTQAVSQELLPGVVHDGEVVDVDALGEALKAFFDGYKLPRRVEIGVSNQQIAVRHLELPRIEDERELAAAVRFQAADAIAMPLDEAVLDHHVLGHDVSPEGAERVRVVVVAARRAMIERFVEAARSAGLKTEGIDLSAFALVRALAGPPNPLEVVVLPQDQQARVYSHLGGITNLAVATGETCLFARPLSTAWDSTSGETTVAELAEEIRLSIDFYMAQPDARPVGDVVLSGPGSTQPELAPQLGSLINLPVSVADPLGGRDRSGIPPGEDPYRYTVATGLSLGVAA